MTATRIIAQVHLAFTEDGQAIIVTRSIDPDERAAIGAWFAAVKGAAAGHAEPLDDGQRWRLEADTDADVYRLTGDHAAIELLQHCMAHYLGGGYGHFSEMLKTWDAPDTVAFVQLSNLLKRAFNSEQPWHPEVTVPTPDGEYWDGAA